MKQLCYVLTSLIIAFLSIFYSNYAIKKTTTIQSPDIIEIKKNPIYYIPTEFIDHLKHVQSAFKRGGYDLVRNNNVTEYWHVMWSFHNPFWSREASVDLPNMMKSLKAHQKVNQLPGASHFTSKIELAKRSYKYTFLPTSFILPSELDKFKEYYNNQNIKDSIWLQKGNKHRGIQLISNPEKLNINQNDEVFIQQFIRPYLIDKKMWDLGIYIAITSIDPLRLYYFDDVLIRFCKSDFNEDLFKANKDSYVVADDYMPPWAISSLRKYYKLGLSTLNVIRAYFKNDQNIDFEEIFWKMKSHILELIIGYLPALQNSAMKYPNGQDNFFSLYRVDFLIDHEIKPWITEINQSPNLSSDHTHDLAMMFKRISYSLLSLVGLTPGGIHNPNTSEEDIEILLHANDIDISYNDCLSCLNDCNILDKCVLCRMCRTQKQSNIIKELISEERSRMGFIPLYPLRQYIISDKNITFNTNNPNDKLLDMWVTIKCSQDYTWC